MKYNYKRISPKLEWGDRIEEIIGFVEMLNPSSALKDTTCEAVA